MTAPGRWILAAVAFAVALVLLARGAGEAAARRARDVAVADSAAAAAVHRVATIRRAAERAGRVYVGTVAPHDAAQAASDRTVHRSSAVVTAALAAADSALAAAADSARTLPALRAELRRSADHIGALVVQVHALQDTLLLERALAQRRIAAAEQLVDSLGALVEAQDTRDVARVRQLAARDATRQPWWRRALGAACEAITTGAGAGGGALAAGPGGAVAGALGGYGVGRTACGR